MLIEKGARVGPQDEDQCTPLHYAASTGHTRAGHLLLSLGADPFVLDSINQMALHMAKEHASSVLMEHMCGSCQCGEQHPVDPMRIHAADVYGRIPLQCSEALVPTSCIRKITHWASDAYINVIDREGTTSVDVGNGCHLSPVMQVHLDLRYLPEPHQPHVKGACHLSRLQTHLLNHILSKALKLHSSGKALLLPSNGNLPDLLLKRTMFLALYQNAKL